MSGKCRGASDDKAVRIQFGALPYRVRQGKIEFLLITSRTTRRWIIPKGWPMKDKKPSETAAQEAFEEAGVKGKIEKRAIGVFRYDKLAEAESAAIPCEVKVFAMLVVRQAETWPEKRQRETRWVSENQAGAIVSDVGLRLLIGAFASRFESRQGPVEP